MPTKAESQATFMKAALNKRNAGKKALVAEHIKEDSEKTETKSVGRNHAERREKLYKKGSVWDKAKK